MHAYLIITDNKDVDIANVMAEKGQSLFQPAYKHFFSKLKIDDVKYLNNFLLTTGHEAHIIYFDNFLDIAQNAFLKTLEEPNKDKQIILLTKSRSNILDTIISRLNIIEINNQDLTEKSKDNFIDLSITDRLEVVKQVLNLEPDEVRPNAQKLISKILNSNSIKLTTEQKQVLAEMHDYLFNSGSSTKQILEFLAVTL